jgi:Tol biopolymer transport system component
MDGSQLLARARLAAVIDGDLDAAMAQYRAIADTAAIPPDVAAEALYELGRLQERIGGDGARKTYERVLRQFSGVRRFADAAASRLEARGWLSRESPTEINRLLWDRAVDLWGTATVDGRHLSFTDWDTGDIAVRDLIDGVSHRVTNKGGFEVAGGEAEGSAISPDGSQIAFTWHRWDPATATEGKFQIRVVRRDGSGERVLIGGPAVSWAEPQAWSPDGKWIAAVINDTAAPDIARVAMISAGDGTVRTLATIADRSPENLCVSPDGGWLAFDTAAPAGSLAPSTSPRTIYVVPTSGGAPVAVLSDGLAMAWTADGVLFRRDRNDRMELHLQPVAGGKAAGASRFLTTVAGMGPAFGLTSAGALIYAETRRTTEAAIAARNPASGEVGAFVIGRPVESGGLGGTSRGVRFSPDGASMFFMTSQNALAIRRLADGAEHRVSPQMTTIGRVDWTGDGRALLVTGSAGGQEGVFRVDPQTGAPTLLVNGANVWLAVLSRDGRTMYYRPQSRPLIARDLASGAERELMVLPAAVFDLKLSPDGKTLAVLGNSRLWLVDTGTGQWRLRFDGQTASVNFRSGDWLPDGSAFIGMMAGDRVSQLFTFPIDGREPVKQPVTAMYRGLSISADGTSIASVRWDNHQQVRSLENFLR